MVMLTTKGLTIGHSIGRNGDILAWQLPGDWEITELLALGQ